MNQGLSRGRVLDAGEYGIEQSQLPPFEQGRVDPRAWFAHPRRPFEIEIGSGKGTFLVQQAPLQPEVNYLGIEKTQEFYRYAADRLRRRDLVNVKMLWGDAGEFLHFWCADGVARIVHLYFSDPWPKKRHHKRRVLQAGSLADLHRVIAPGGELRLVTDHDALWAWYEDLVGRHAHLFERRSFDRVESAGAGEIVGTNFERKYRTEGRPFHAMTLVRR